MAVTAPHAGSAATTAAAPPHIPVLRHGSTYESLDTVTLVDHRSGAAVADVSQANAGLIRRDVRTTDACAAVLRAIPIVDLLRMCADAGEQFMDGTLPLGVHGESQTAQDYVEALSATSGMPHTLCRGNMQKVNTVFTEMETILRGLARGLDLTLLDQGIGDQDGMTLSFAHATSSLGVILPSNSPGVNSVWMPAVALKVPVVLKPGREEPWTPLRIVQAFIAAGIPADAFGFYPTDHEGAGTIVEKCQRSLVFGDEKTTKKYRGSPGIQIHGPGRSKILIGPDEIDNWRDHLDVLVGSIVNNGGRSYINISSIFVTAHADEIADELARRVASVDPLPAADASAVLSAHANPRIANLIDRAIDGAASSDGAREVTAEHRAGPRLVERDGAHLRPTIVRCPSIDHPLANTEYMFPFASVVEVPADQWMDTIGPSLVVTAITRDPQLVAPLLSSPLIDRLNIGPVPTTRVDWDQPHEGNLFEFLYARRAIHRRDDW